MSGNRPYPGGLHYRASGSRFIERLEPRTLLAATSQGSITPIAVPASLPAKQVEYLNRGLVAMYRGGGNVYLSWRLLGTDPGNISFNLYRSANNGAAVKRNNSPITQTTDFTDTGVTISQSNRYFVRPIINGVEQAPSPSFTLAPNTPNRQYLNIPLQIPPGGTNPGIPTATDPNPAPHTYTYTANDASVGDLDGDGEYEIILKWMPTDEGGATVNIMSGPMIMDAYRLDGTRLWRINLGVNIRASAQYSAFLVYDLDGDGKSELVCRTAPGTIDGTNHNVLLGSDSASADYRDINNGGRVTSGPEYLTVFNGQTGAAMATVPYTPDRVNVSSWGDDYGNRAEQILIAPAYLDGQRPSIVIGRGIFPGQSAGRAVRNELTAWDWRNGQLTMRWWFRADKNASAYGLPDQNTSYIGQGTYDMQPADVDGDGRDEIVYGSMTVDDNGTGLYSTGIGHGDALHVSDMDPSRPGLEVFMPHESPAEYGPSGGSFRSGATGQVYYSIDGHASDVGRGVAFDVDPRYLGYEAWQSADASMYNTAGTAISSRPANYNFGIWWDADPLRELLTGTTIDKWNWNTQTTNRTFTVYQAAPISSNNGTKATPCLSGDILGDWREEVLFRASDNASLYLFTTVTPATNRIYTLMHDVQYREAIAWQNVGYNQPPHPSFFLGAANSSNAFSTVPTPNIYLAAADNTPPTVTASAFLYETAQRFTVQFSEPMKASTISEIDLIIHPTSCAGIDIVPYTYSYNASLQTVTFYVLNPLPDGNYTATMPAGSVKDAADNSLASAYSFDFFALAGDADHNRVVDINDLSILSSNWQGSGKTFSQGDFNYDTNVDAMDLSILANNWQRILSAPSSALAASLSRPRSRSVSRMIELI